MCVPSALFLLDFFDYWTDQLATNVYGLFFFCFLLRWLKLLCRIWSEKLVSDVGNLIIEELQDADSGKYTCSAVYTSSQRLEAHINLTTIGIIQNYTSFLFFSSLLSD